MGSAHLGGEDLSSEEVEDGVDAEAVGHEHGDDDDEGEEAEEGVGGEEEVLPVGEGGHGAPTERQDGGAGAVDVPPVARPQGGGGATGHHHPAGRTVTQLPRVSDDPFFSHYRILTL